MMAVEGALTGNTERIYQAMANDPLTAAVLSLAEVEGSLDQGHLGLRGPRRAGATGYGIRPALASRRRRRGSCYVSLPMQGA